METRSRASLFSYASDIDAGVGGDEGGGDGGDAGSELSDASWVACEAGSLVDTFGWRAIRAWQDCQKYGPDWPDWRCDAGRPGRRTSGDCICWAVWEGVDFYGEWADDIAAYLRAMQRLDDDGATITTDAE